MDIETLSIAALIILSLTVMGIATAMIIGLWL